MWESWVLSLGWKGPLEKGAATHSSILVFWLGELHGMCSPWGHRVRHDWATFTYRIGLVVMHSQFLFIWKHLNFSLIIEEQLGQTQDSWLTVFSFTISSVSFSALVASKFSDNKWADNLTENDLQASFLLMFLRFFSLIFSSLIIMYVNVEIFELILRSWLSVLEVFIHYFFT